MRSRAEIIAAIEKEYGELNALERALVEAEIERIKASREVADKPA